MSITQTLRVMKLTAIFLTVLAVNVMAGSYAQTISYSGKNVPLKLLFAAIKKQTGYYVVYDNAKIQNKKPVTISVTNVLLRDFLSTILKDKGLDYSITKNTITVYQREVSPPLDNSIPNVYIDTVISPVPTINVSGKIQNEKGDPIPGAAVQVKGNLSKGTIADFNGFFELKGIPENSIVIISGVNIERLEVKVNGRTNLGLLTAKLKTSTLKDVSVEVNTGYYTIKPNQVTGSFEKIDNSLFDRRVSSDITSRLEGLVSNLYVSKTGSNPELFLRGIVSFSSGNHPLIVLDNFPYEGDLSTINPNDVESISILKDAGAASIWGASAGNGVIVITTKKGEYNRKLKVSINTNFTFQGKPQLMKDPNFLTSTEFIETEKFLFSKGFYDNQLRSPAYYILSPVVETLYKQQNGLISQDQANQQINEMGKYDIRNDMLKYLYQNDWIQQTYLSIEAGGSQFNTRLSFGYDFDGSSTIGNNSKRYSLNSTTTFRPIQKLELQIGLNGSFTKGVSNGISSIIPGGGKTTIYPYARLADDNGNPLALEKNYRNNFTDTAGNGLFLDWKYRPLEERELNDNYSEGMNLLTSFSAKYSFTNSLQAEFRSQWMNNVQNSSYYSKAESYDARNMVNLYSQFAGTSVYRPIPLGGILDQSQSKGVAWGTRVQLNYNHNWNTDHHLMAIGGVEVREANNKFSQSRLYGYDDENLTYSNVDYVSLFPLYGNKGTASIPAMNNLSNTTNRFVSTFANANYTFKNKYSLSASARKDASNIFGVSTNKKWKPLWSLGAAWNVSSESFYKVKFLSLLKIRFTWGYTGNISSSTSAISIIQYRPGISPTNLPYADLRSAPNPDLRWEKVLTRNLGLDFGTKNNSITGSIDYYWKKSTDLLSSVPLDPTTGINLLTINSAQLSGYGLDLRLNARIIDRNIKWKALFLFSYLHDNVDEYYNVSSNKGSYPSSGYLITPITGQSPYSLISYKWLGLDPASGNPLGVINGIESQNYSGITRTTSWDDLVFTGTTRPSYFGSLINTISWKKLSISIGISYRMGYYFRKNTINYGDLFTRWIGNSDLNKRWQNPGDELITSVPSMVYPADSYRDKFYQFSEATVEKGDLIRFKDFNITYNLSLKHPKKGGIQNIQLFTYWDNIGLLWRANKSNLDPEFGYSLPPSLKISFGIKTEF